MKSHPFEVIPVLDIRHGVAVRAVAGDRVNYQQLVTSLAAGADPVAVAQGYRRLYPFPTLYVADLDGIEGQGGNAAMLGQLVTECPGMTIWADDGSADELGVTRMLGNPHVTAVVGSESHLGASELQRLIEHFGDRIILSLDFAGDEFKGTNKLLADATRWPRRVIVMMLARVGTDRGPDLERIADIAQRAGKARLVYAAGGVRNRADLLAVSKAGASGALIASALHNGQLRLPFFDGDCLGSDPSHR